MNIFQVKKEKFLVIISKILFVLFEMFEDKMLLVSFIKDWHMRFMDLGKKYMQREKVS